MPVNTLSVGVAVTPTVIHTYLSHYLNRGPLAEKPTAHISYHQGLELIRRFLHYASLHTVDELQAFTSQWVPVPQWVHAKVVEIPSSQLKRSAEYINAQLGPAGIEAVGGKTWWQWRTDGTPLKAEWIEMRKDHNARRQLNIEKGDRIMLYVHGGAYFFGSVDEHRYQLQRHARKLKARVLAPRYRLAPQFPFPCGLYDCVATYLYLLSEKHDPSTILLAGDSAGGGMVLSMLVVLRDQGIPLPAGAILISPWVDLTHSFPSLDGDGKWDYIPAHGFIHKPSMSWPPPNADDLLELERPSEEPKQKKRQSLRIPLSKDKKEEHEADEEAQTGRIRGYSILSGDRPDIHRNASSSATGHGDDVWVSQDGTYSVGPKSMLSVQLENDKRIEIKDQIQLYTANHLLTHPLVSPALQPSLGGLPPLLIQVGGGELLRDEQIYVAHKAAQPSAYLPPPSNNQTAEAIEAQAAKYNPTDVQLQLWDDMCHVGPTLSFTRPAKYMYRSIAQFGAWALAHAQKKSIDILDDDNISVVSSDSSASSDADTLEPSMSESDMKTSKTKASVKNATQQDTIIVGKAGDPLPPFEHHMIRQRIDRHGHIHPLVAKEEFEALNLPIATIGVPKPGPVGKWMKAQQQWNSKFAKQKIKIQKQRKQDMAKGFDRFEGETPPPTALAGRRVKDMKAEKAKKKSWGMSMWSGWGSKHDEDTIDREEKADQAPDQKKHPKAAGESSLSNVDGAETQEGAREEKTATGLDAKGTDRSRSRSRHSAVIDRGQATASDEDLARAAPSSPNLAEATVLAPERQASPPPSSSAELRQPELSVPGVVVSDNPQSPDTLIPATDTLTTRPTKGGIAYPFSLRVDPDGGREVNASTVTLQSVDIKTPSAVEVPQAEKELGAGLNLTSGPLEKKDEGEKKEKQQGQETTDVTFSNVDEKKDGESEKMQRPVVERFETAQEDLSMLASGNDKA